MARIKIRIDSVSQFFFFLGAFLKQFYIFPSGSLQMGDICLGISFIFALRRVSRSKFGNNENDSLLLLYLIAIFVINIFYSAVYMTTSFLVSAVYYLFNYIVVLAFRENCSDESFLLRLQITLKLSVIAQALIYFSGRGIWYGGSRYMGTFNDPNQFGFYIFSSVLLIYAISVIQKQKYPIIWVFLMSFLVLESASTGMALGVACFLIVSVFSILTKKGRYAPLLFLFTVLLIVALIILARSNLLKLPSYITDSSLYERLNMKINEFTEGESVVDGVSSDRGWFLLKEYWYMIIYGAGEGASSRFVGWGGEVHSSIFGPLFYYGLIPFSIWMQWCFKQFRSINKRLICVYIALFTESITLVNTRQPFFWMLLAIASFSGNKNGAMTEGKKIDDKCYCPNL